jgi:hypothetical protein
MPFTKLFLSWVVGITLVISGLLSDAHAKPKSTVFGCSVDDLQTTFASSCIKQADQDIMNGNSYIHVVICEAGQQKCCTVNGSGQILNCRRPAGSAATRQPLQQLTPVKPSAGPIQSRSAALTEDLGEESDIPSWLTADWMNKHEVSEQSK